MKLSSRNRAFYTNELLLVIAVFAIWIAVSIPIYAHAIKFLSRHGEAVGPLQQLQAIGIALIGGPLMMTIICASFGSLIWLGEQVTQRLRRDR